MKRVVVTGIGAVTPLANNFIDSWRAALEGTSGIQQITRFDASNLPWNAAGELKGFNPELCLSKKEILRLDPFVHYAVSAAVMAANDAGLIKQVSSVKCLPPNVSIGGQVSETPLSKEGHGGVDSELRTPNSELLNSAGVIIGSSRGGITTIEKELSKLLTPNSKLSSYLMPSTTISIAASYAAQKLGIKGICLGLSNACASGANAIGEAYRLIRHGYGDIILAGGTEAPICRLCVEGYGISGALSKVDSSSASRPFDKKRDGFVIAEGACVLALEEYGSALRRGAKIYGEIIGYSSTTDAFHITRPDAKGEVRAIMLALKEAGISPEEVDYINAHATATPIGDKTEAEALKRVFKKRTPVNSIKSMTGHMLAASGAFETACTLMSLKEGVIPPTINHSENDPECDINVITEKTEAVIRTAASNSFGFGGVNAVLVLRSAEEQ